MPAQASELSQSYVSFGPGYSAAQLSLDVGSADGSVEVFSIDTTGAIFEVCAGRQQGLWQSPFSVGAEFCGVFGSVSGTGSYTLSGMDQSGTLRLSAETDQRYALRLLVGVAPTDQWSVHAYAAANAARFKLSAEIQTEDEQFFDSSEGWGFGASVGLRSVNQFPGGQSFVISLDYSLYEAEQDFLLDEELFTAKARQPTLSLMGTYRF